MKALTILTLAFALVFTGSDLWSEPGQARQPVAATASLPHSTVLPGVPVDITVTLTNVSQRTVSVGLRARVIVTLPDGSVFPPPDAPADRNDRQALEPYAGSSPETSIELAPGEAIQRVISWDRAPRNWSHYDVYSGPGKYMIAVELERGTDDPGPNYVGVIRSSSARLERVVPVGEDEVLWTRMQEVAGGHWSDDAFAATEPGVAMAKEIVQLHPASSYYPYALLLSKSFKEEQDIGPLLEAAERFHDSPAFPYLLKAAGDAALYEARKTHGAQHDSSGAKKFYDLAETYFREARKTNSLAIRGDTERSLDSVERERIKLKVR